MGIAIGVKIGSANSVAVVASEHSWESSLSVETAALVDAADFLDRVGDPVPVLDAHGQSRPAAQIHAEAVAALVARLEPAGGSVAHLTVVHPDTWTTQAVDEARAALDAHDGGLTSAISWVAESIATLAAVEHSEGAFGDGLVIGYDLGASGLTVTVLATGAEPRVVGRPLRLDSVSGNEFDRLLLGHTLRATGIDAEIADPSRASSVLDDLTRLRTECRAAKEALSVDTDAVVDVRLGEESTVARVVRDDIEDLVRAPIAESVAVIREALASAGADRAGVNPAAAVTAIVLGGGGAVIPLVTETLSSTLRLPVILDPEPASASAAGGALIGVAAIGARASAAVVPTAAESTVRMPAALPEERPLREIVPAPSTPVTAPAPRLSRRRRGVLITLGAAALVLVSAAGLSVGTGLVGSTGEATPPPAGAVTTAASSAGTGGRPAPTVVDARPGTSTPGAAAGPGSGTPAPRQAASDTPAAGAPAPRTSAPGGQTSAPPAPAGPSNPEAPSNPGTSPTPGENPPAEVPEPSPGDGSGGGGGTGTSPGGVLQVPGRILDGTGQVLCGVTRVVC